MTTIRNPRPSVAQSLAAEMRPMRLTVTAGHTLDFIGHGHRATVTATTGEATEGPMRFKTLQCAYEHLRTAEGATAALLARICGGRA